MNGPSVLGKKEDQNVQTEADFKSKFKSCK